VKFLSVLILSVVSLTANATFVTHLSNTQIDVNLEWLDVTETQGMSYDQIRDAYGISNSGYSISGWRFAYQSEFDELVNQYGLTNSAASSSAQAGAQDIIDGLGLTKINWNGTSIGTIGFLDRAYHENGTFNSVNINNNGGYIWDGTWNDRDWKNNTVGGFLVRTPSTVPVPPAFLLMGTGLIGLLIRKAV
jgi:hypothetical protein